MGPLLWRKAAEHPLFHFQAVLLPQCIRLLPCRRQLDQISPLIRLVGMPSHEAALFQAVQHPAHCRRVHVIIIRQLALAAGAVSAQISQDLGLPGPQAKFCETWPQNAALGMECPIEQDVEGLLHLDAPN